MLEYAINNEMEASGNLPPFLINNPIFRGDKAMTELILTKICTKCQAEKPVDEFFKDKTHKDGLTSGCKICRNAYHKEYYYTHQDEILAQVKGYNKTHKDERAAYRRANRDKLKANMAAYHQEYRDEEAAYRQTHKAEFAAYKAIYLQTPAGKASNRKKEHKRRALKIGVGYEEFNPNEVLERDGYRCQLCRKKTRPDYNRLHPLFPNLDHIDPLSKGGEHSKKNTQCLCRECNMKKHNTGIGDQLRLFG